MRRTRLVLLVSLLWLLAAVLACLAIAWLGPGLAGFAIAALALLAALTASLLIGRATEQQFADKLGELGKAVGLSGAETHSVEAIVANLCSRLERAHLFKGAFAELEQPAALLASDGTILGASRGMRQIEPKAAEGETADVLFGQGSFGTGGGVAEETLLVADGRRFDARRQPAGGGRVLIELKPAGHYISDDELDAFAEALAGGHTSFRFDRQALEQSPALRALEGGLESFDLGARALAQMLGGDDIDPAYLRSHAGFAPQVRGLNDTLKVLVDERDEAVEARDLMENKMAAVLNAIDRYRSSVTSMAEFADKSRTGVTVAGAAVERGRLKLKTVRALQREVVGAATDAATVIERAQASVTGVDAATIEIDKLVASIEDVSFRTNLLALNAAVEAARAGDKGAGFAVVADEVRTLAQATQRTARDIRALVGTSRAQSEVSVAEAGTLKNILGGLGRHLENLSNETDMIAGALDEGSGALTRLDGHVGAVGDEAAKALLLPKRKPA